MLENAQGKFDDFQLWHTDYDISTYIGNVLSGKFDVAAKRIPCYAFYIAEEKQEEIKKLNITLPEGYFNLVAPLSLWNQISLLDICRFTFCQLDPEADHQFVSSTWPYASKTEAANVRAKLKHLPSIGVKHDGQLVAFELMHHTGKLVYGWRVLKLLARTEQS